MLTTGSELEAKGCSCERRGAAGTTNTPPLSTRQLRVEHALHHSSAGGHHTRALVQDLVQRALTRMSFGKTEALGDVAMCGDAMLCEDDCTVYVLLMWLMPSWASVMLDPPPSPPPASPPSC